MNLLHAIAFQYLSAKRPYPHKIIDHFILDKLDPAYNHSSSKEGRKWQIKRKKIQEHYVFLIKSILHDFVLLY